MLYIVATPIGNLKDITLRALEVLKSVDAIICEDTRRSSILLNHYQIKKPLHVLNDFNENDKVSYFIQKLQAGENLALISDAGTPLINDPGYKLVRECLKQQIPVDSLPGPSSILAALTLSGLPPHPFTYLGYPPEKSSARIKLFESLKSHTLESTYIILVSPYKLTQTLMDIKEVLGNIELVLAAELTKLHQSVQSHIINTWLEKYHNTKPKGEFMILFRK